MFVCTISGIKYPLALVQAYRPVGVRPRKDKDMGLLRIRKERKTELISIQSVIRGAVAFSVSEDPLESDERLVFDALDGDMFLRVKELFPEHTLGR